MLLKPKLKTLGGRNGHVVRTSKSNGLCAFTAILQVAKAGGALDPEGATMSDPGIGKLARQEFMKIRQTKAIENSKEFATLLQKQIAAHMYRKE